VQLNSPPPCVASALPDVSTTLWVRLTVSTVVLVPCLMWPGHFLATSALMVNILSLTQLQCARTARSALVVAVPPLSVRPVSPVSTLMSLVSLTASCAVWVNTKAHQAPLAAPSAMPVRLRPFLDRPTATSVEQERSVVPSLVPVPTVLPVSSIPTHRAFPAALVRQAPSRLSRA
jgi:hypothetical protein